MAEPTLTAVFGAGASQTASTITIDKADLVITGLTASSSNTAESLLAAIALKAKIALTSAGYESNSNQSITIEPGFDSITQRVIDNTTYNYRLNQLTLNFYQVDAGAIDPDNY